MTKEAFSCTRGGLTIRGHVFREAAGVRPAVILSHGFTANEKTNFKYAKVLASLGFAAFTYDFCGGGIRTKSDGRTQDMTLFTEVEDLCAVLDAVRARPDVDPRHITLLGCSQGGAVSALVARKRPGDLEKLVLFYPALCIPDDARAGRMMFAKFDPSNLPEILARFPMKLGAGYARSVLDVDIFQEIGGFDGPVLLLHGTKDKIVDISYARRAKSCYADCSYHEIEKGKHGFRGKYDREAIALLSAFMTK